MKERPILFTAPMVRAILDGRKTQTRRIGKHQMDSATELGVSYNLHATKGEEAVATYRAFPDGGSARWGICECPYGIPGNRLWVRETFGFHGEEKILVQRADCGPLHEATTKWKPSIFMPRWASRIALEIERLRVERLQDISEEDAKAEGAECPGCASPEHEPCSYRAGYRLLWETINGPGSWSKNPWVWVIEFKRLTP